MKVLHTRKLILRDNFSKDKTLLLVWFLSAIMWKHYGYEPILYVDNAVYDLLKPYSIDDLYDEINTEYFEDPNTFKNLKMFEFWAMPKLRALRHEMIEKNNDVIACDTDIVPTDDLKRMWNNAEIVVWSNGEFKEMFTVYPGKDWISTPKNYTYPWWVKFNAQPLNTGILHFRHNNVAEEYFAAQDKFALHNENPLHNDSTQTMCVVEQLFLGNYIYNKNISYTCVQPLQDSVFNRNAFHTHSYKAILAHNQLASVVWSIDLLLIIKKYNKDYFYKLMKLPLFKEEREYFKRKGYKWLHIQELDKYIDT